MKYLLFLLAGLGGFFLAGPVGLLLFIIILLVLDLALADWRLVTNKITAKKMFYILKHAAEFEKKEMCRALLKRKIIVLPVFRRFGQTQYFTYEFYEIIEETAARGLWNENKALKLKSFFIKNGIALEEISSLIKKHFPRNRQAYALFGLEPEVHWETVKAKYRQELKKSHPDLNRDQDGHDNLVELQNAYELIKTEKTAMYEILP